MTTITNWCMEMHAFLPDVRVAQATGVYGIMDTAMPPFPMTVYQLLAIKLDNVRITGDSQGFDGPVVACAMTEGGRNLGKGEGRMFFAYLTPGTIGRVLKIDPTTLTTPRVIEPGESAVLDDLLPAMVTNRHDRKALVETMNAHLLDALAVSTPMGLAAVVHMELIRQERPVIAHIASDLGASQRTVERQFKSCFGCSPSRYLRHLRLSRATNGGPFDLRWDKVSPEVEYFDQSHWLRDVRTIYGAPPSKLNTGVSANWLHYPDGIFDPALARDEWIEEEYRLRADAYHTARDAVRKRYLEAKMAAGSHLPK